MVSTWDQKGDEIAVGDDEVRMALQKGDGVGDRLRQHDIVVRNQDNVRRGHVGHGSRKLVCHAVLGPEMPELGNARSGTANRFGICRLARIQHDDAVSESIAAQKVQLPRAFVRPILVGKSAVSIMPPRGPRRIAAASTTSSISASDRLA